MSTTLFSNASILDTRAGALKDGHVLIRDGRIAEVADTPITTATADRTVDLKGKILMPGLCDGHVHVIAVTASFPSLIRMSPFYVMARTAPIMEAMLMRGFTTVRDGGGADFGIAKAVDEGHITGPRVLFCGHALSPAGGHGDMRSPGENFADVGYQHPSLGMVVNGVPEVRRAAREELRRGCDHVKIMASGGVSSPTDRIDSDQFSREEIAAAVEEAAMANRYVMAHTYSSRAVTRCVELGVRTVEHGNLIDAACCAEIVKHEAYLVPTLATYFALKEEGAENGLSDDMVAKIDDVLGSGVAAVETAQRAGVKMAYGTDLLGRMHRHQLNEFNLRKDVVPTPDLIRQATCGAAEAFMADGDFGVIEPGARGDVLVSAGNPLDDITVLTRPEENLLAIMKGGTFYKNLLN
ncbi:metal-dependent hydrolase family protein [Acuticoccus mangrovi]|uniref:Amidohydrolase family protein n=1 Tax=Acuticoccus mangrovi TaxID=2796142 RepID=A0A934IU07_9HYPH|nr:amidohydrolase family protein [Acuticoccus mangrovi]MBJ3778806.1 amidohydrolase family protein [Acuticoccus mangrovi]